METLEPEFRDRVNTTKCLLFNYKEQSFDAGVNCAFAKTLADIYNDIDLMRIRYFEGLERKTTSGFSWHKRASNQHQETSQ